MNVLIVRLSALGDVIHALPLAANLRRAGHRVGWIVEAPFEPLLSRNPNLDAVFTAETRRWRRRPGSVETRGALASLRRKLRAFGAEAVLDAQANPKSWWICLLSPGSRIVLDDRSVRSDWTRRLSSVRVSPAEAAGHVSDRNLALLGPLRVPAHVRTPDARYLLKSPAPRAEEFLRGVARPFALYHPGAGWASKAWGEERFAELARTVSDERGISPVVSWGPGDEICAEGLSRRLGAPLIPPSTLPELSRIIAESSFFAAGDTGPLHLADALGVPTVSFFGPTDPERNGPYRRSGPVFWAGLPCAPCHRRYGRTKPCLTALEPRPVARSVVEWLARA
jgi:heptosyltransferase-1